MVSNQQSDNDASVGLMSPLMAAIELAMNQYIRLDEETQKSLKRFEGKVVKLQITSPSIELFLLPGESGIQVLNHYQDLADTTISGSAVAFANLGLATDKQKNQAVFSGRIKISGDINLGQKFQALFENIDIDWEEHLAQIFGDIIAHKIGNLGRRFWSWNQQTRESLALDIAEFLQYETRDLIERREIGAFLNQIDMARSDVDRLEARINRLFTTLEQKNSQ